MSYIGQHLPAFKLNAYQHGDFHEVSDTDLKGKWAVICFYRFFFRLPDRTWRLARSL